MKDLITPNEPVLIGQQPAEKPFLLVKDKEGHSLEIFVRNGKWDVVMRGAQMVDAAKDWCKELSAQFNEEFDRRVKQYAEIGFVGTVSFAGELFDVKVEKGIMHIGGKTVDDFIKDASPEMLAQLAKRGLGLKLQDAV